MEDRPAVEGQVVERWSVHGIECAIVAGPHSLNGYVRLPALLVEEGIRVDVQVHGSITTVDEDGSVGNPDTNGWVGFDTVHPGDFWDPDELEPYLRTERDREYAASARRDGEVRWTLDRLRAEVESFAEQIASAARWQAANRL